MSGLIGIGHRSVGYPAFWTSVLALHRPPGTILACLEGTYIDTFRNTIVKEAIESRVDWVVFLDDDHILPPDTITRLLSHNVPVVGALALKRDHPYTAIPMIADKDTPVDGKYVPLPEQWYRTGALVKVDVLPMNATLVRMDVFEHIAEPWFHMGDSAKGRSEDVAFSEAVAAAGYSIYCDTALRIPHLTVAAVYIDAHGNRRFGSASEVDGRALISQ